MMGTYYFVPYLASRGHAGVFVLAFGDVNKLLIVPQQWKAFNCASNYMFFIKVYTYYNTLYIVKKEDALRFRCGGQVVQP